MPQLTRLCGVQFSAVLNEKKAKIRELKQRAEDLERKLQDEEHSVRPRALP
jgi:hypothetical protein